MFHGYIYEIRVATSFTLEEVIFMMGVADLHYDYVVKEMSRPRGILYGLRNAALWTEEARAQDPDEKPITLALDFKHLDTMMKCMEQADFWYSTIGYTPAVAAELVLGIRKQLRELMDAINQRHMELHVTYKSDSHYFKDS